MRYKNGTKTTEARCVHTCDVSPSESQPRRHLHGSAMVLSARIDRHHDALKTWKLNRTIKNTRRGKKQKTFYNIEFWARQGIRDFWLVFGQFDPPQEGDRERTSILLNILEMYAMLCFRTLPINVLRKYLPAGFHLQHLWNGLNVANPLFQNRRYINDTNPRMTDYRPAYGIGEVWRHDDASKGDKPNVELVCRGRSNSNDLLVDRTPRYEIATGAYLACFRRHPSCHCSFQWISR